MNIEDTYTPRERSVVATLSRLRPGPALDADTKARAKDRLMLLLTAEHAAAQGGSGGSMASAS